MVQKVLRGKSKGKSSGAVRKHQGESKKKSTFTKRKHTTESKARANYSSAVETAMAARVPSDQRSKLKIVIASGPMTKKKNMKKPLTRGRKRK